MLLVRVELFQQRSVRGGRSTGFVVQERDQARVFLQYALGIVRPVSMRGACAGGRRFVVGSTHRQEQIEARLVVPKLDKGPVDAFLLVLGLLVRKDELDKVLLQLLIGQIDAELLERVGLCVGGRVGVGLRGVARSAGVVLCLAMQWSVMQGDAVGRTAKFSKPKISRTPISPWCLGDDEDGRTDSVRPAFAWHAWCGPWTHLAASGLTMREFMDSTIQRKRRS